MKRYIYVILSVFTLAFFGACEDEMSPDTQAPAIELTDPVPGESFAAGTDIPFNAVMTDDQALGTYSIDIHSNFDEHAHGRRMSDPDLIAFTYKKNFDLPADKVHAVDLSGEILIPENAIAGPHHFIVQAIDAEGNATSYQDDSTVEIEILMTNNSMPVISLTNLEGRELEIEAGRELLVEGSIADPEHASLQGIEEVMIMLGEDDHEGEHDHDHARKAEEALFEAEIHHEQLDQYKNQDGSLNISGMINYTLDATTAADLEAEGVDHLVLKFTVIDMQGNYTIEKVPVHIHSD